jgi:hypothetical protein
VGNDVAKLLAARASRSFVLVVCGPSPVAIEGRTRLCVHGAGTATNKEIRLFMSGTCQTVEGEPTVGAEDEPAQPDKVQRRCTNSNVLPSYFFWNAKTRFQSAFMSTTVQPLACAWSSALSSLPTLDCRS